MAENQDMGSAVERSTDGKSAGERSAGERSAGERSACPVTIKADMKDKGLCSVLT